MSQSALAAACGVSQPAVSSWRRGHTRPRPAHLDLIARELELDPGALRKAAGYAAADPTLEPPDRFFDSMLNMATQMLETIRSSRFSAPLIALEQADIVRGNLVRDDQLLSAPQRTKALQLVAQVLVTKGRILCECMSASDAARQMAGIADRLDKIAEDLGDGEIHGYADTTRACISYMAGGQRESLRLNERARTTIRDPTWTLDVSRALAISMGTLGQEDQLRKQEGRIRGLLQKEAYGTHAAASYVLEGLARGHALLKSDAAPEIMEEAQRYHALATDGIGRQPLREIQLLRSRAMVESELDGRSVTTAERTVSQAKELAENYGYHRYLSELVRFEKGLGARLATSRG